MSRFAAFRNLSTGILYWFIIIAIILFLIWLIISGVGNCTSNKEGYVPDVNDAEYEIHIHATGEILFARECNNNSDGVYILHGYYEYKDDKYCWHDSDLILDEKYFGKITVIKR